jgi:hypothetical protein
VCGGGGGGGGILCASFNTDVSTVELSALV